MRDTFEMIKCVSDPMSWQRRAPVDNREGLDFCEILIFGSTQSCPQYPINVEYKLI